MTRAKPDKHSSAPSRGAFDWASIRGEYEAGKSVAYLSRKYGPSRTAIAKHAKKEAWEVDRDSESKIRKATKAKLAKLDRIDDPVTKDEAIEAEADRRVSIIHGHRALFDQVKSLFSEALALREEKLIGEAGKRVKVGGVAVAFDAMKLAKISSETARNIMLGERLAYGIAEGDERPPGDLAEDDRALLDRWLDEYSGKK